MRIIAVQYDKQDFGIKTIICAIRVDKRGEAVDILYCKSLES